MCTCVKVVKMVDGGDKLVGRIFLVASMGKNKKWLDLEKKEEEESAFEANYCPSSGSSTCSTESTISFTSSRVTPGIIRSASSNARCRLVNAT